MKEYTEEQKQQIKTNPPINMSQQEAAIYVGISPRQMVKEAQGALRSGLLKCARFGSRKIYRKLDLDRWMDARISLQAA